MILGLEKPDAGEFVVGDTVKLSYVSQDRFEDSDKRSVWQYVSGGAETIAIGNKDVNSRAYIARFGFTGQDQQKPIGVLSGGERNRIHLAMALKQGGNVLLLTNPQTTWMFIHFEHSKLL